MKKTIIMSAFFALVLTGFSSCKKDWSCSCTDQSGNTTSSSINNETLINARSKCKDMGFSVGAVSESCSLQ
jgi:hypothetical protein